MYTNVYLSVKSYFNKIARDRIYTFSATAVFFLILSIFPFMILLLTIIQYTPFSEEFLLDAIAKNLPSIVVPIIQGMVDEIYTTTSGATLIFVSAIGAIWSASKGIMAIVRGVNVCFNINDKRNYFTVRIWCCFYVLGALLMLLLGLGISAYWAVLYNRIGGYLGPFDKFITFLVQQRLPLMLFFFTLLFMLIFKFFPARHQKFFRMFPGAFIAAVGWYLTSKLLALYVKHFPNFTYTYGSITAIIVFMLYLYFSMYILFMCGEFNFFMNILFEKSRRKRLRDKSRRYESKMATKALNKKKLQKEIEKIDNINN